MQKEFNHQNPTVRFREIVGYIAGIVISRGSKFDIYYGAKMYGKKEELVAVQNVEIIVTNEEHEMSSNDFFEVRLKTNEGKLEVKGEVTDEYVSFNCLKKTKYEHTVNHFVATDFSELEKKLHCWFDSVE